MEYKAPQPYPNTDLDWVKNIYVFLGGSIEMGAAELWQDKVVAAFKDDPHVIFLNPRRDDWDSSWIQDPTPGTQFHEQVTWELDGQDIADIHLYYFDDNTKSPITLLELGSYGGTSSIVRCTPNFWRYGNVAVYCDRVGATLVDSTDSMIGELDLWIHKEKEYKGII